MPLGAFQAVDTIAAGAEDCVIGLLDGADASHLKMCQKALQVAVQLVLCAEMTILGNPYADQDQRDAEYRGKFHERETAGAGAPGLCRGDVHVVPS